MPHNSNSSKTELIHNYDHYTQVIEKIKFTKKSLWIGTADIKDLHVKSFNGSIPFLSVLSDLIQKGVSIRLLHAKEPGPRFKADFKKYPLLKNMEMDLCPRVHFKMIIVDSNWAYSGSANLTGAALGMKSKNTRNFESGILTTDLSMVESLEEQFDQVWMGSNCANCGRKEYCPKPLNSL